MSTANAMNRSTCSFSADAEILKSKLEEADCIVIGAGSGLSTSAGLEYSGERFEKNFADFIEKYHIHDIYSGGFYPFETREEFWAWWSRHIFLNRYSEIPKPVYSRLLDLVRDRDYFVITTNVDHCFQRSGFDKKRLFYTQGDYGLLQCSTPCHYKTYDNEALVRQMMKSQRDMRVPSELVPLCPMCSEPMTTNLRGDDKFVQDDGWYAAAYRYEEFLRSHSGKRILFLELGIGGNTPAIIKYPFWRMTLQDPNAFYACINYGEAVCPPQIRERAVCINYDIGTVLEMLF